MTENSHFQELLGNRAAAFDNAGDIPTDRRQEPLGVETRMAVEVPILDADHGIHKIVGKITSRGIGHLKRAYPSEHLAIRRFNEKGRFAVARNGPFRRKIVKHPKHGAYHGHRAKHSDESDRFGEPANSAPQRGPFSANG